jgi:hypothetical protein
MSKDTKDEKVKLEEIYLKANNIFELQEIEKSLEVKEENLYLRALNKLCWKESEKSALKVIADEAQRVYEQCENAENISIGYMDILRSLSWKQDEETVLEEIAEKAAEVYEKNQSFKKIASHYMGVLSDLSRKQKLDSFMQDVVAEANRVYAQNAGSERIANEYLIILGNLCEIQEGKFLWEEVAEDARAVYEKHKNYERVINNYLSFQGKLYMVQKAKSDLEAIVAEIKSVYEENNTAENVVREYIEVLSRLFKCEEDESELKKIEEEGARVYKKHSASELIAGEYVTFLFNIIIKGGEEAKLKEIEELAKSVYEQNKTSELVVIGYLSILNVVPWKQEKTTLDEARRVYNNISSNDVSLWYMVGRSMLYQIQEDRGDLIQTLEEANRVYRQNKDLETVAIEYLRGLRILSNKKNQECLLWDIANKADEVFTQYQTSEDGARFYLKILIRLILKGDLSLDVSDAILKMCDILQKYNHLIDEAVSCIDQIMFLEESIETNVGKYTRMFMDFAILGKFKNPLRKTKYNIIFDVYKYLSVDELNRLIKIFNLVQKIKNQLVVKNPENLRFGHYTTGKVLQLFLKQEEKTRYEIKVKSRLNNVDYMNDPSEGKVLNQLLQIDTSSQKLSLKPSPWFLMCLSTAIDELTMWAQYGEKAKGVCLVLKSSDFSKVNNSSDIPTLKHDGKSVLKNPEDNKNKLDSKAKDIIYRIGYLSKSKKSKLLLKKDYNKSFSQNEINVLNKYLLDLKKSVKKINKNSKLYEAVNECLEEIQYLFKTADYSYEHELRLLKYSPLESDNKNIKINNSEEIAKLYIERDNPIQIAEVIFGPKFENPENVTPLLQLLDKNIKFSQSQIPFK